MYSEMEKRQSGYSYVKRWQLI